MALSGLVDYKCAGCGYFILSARLTGDDVIETKCRICKLVQTFHGPVKTELALSGMKDFRCATVRDGWRRGEDESKRLCDRKLFRYRLGAGALVRMICPRCAETSLLNPLI